MSFLCRLPYYMNLFKHDLTTQIYISILSLLCSMPKYINLNILCLLHGMPYYTNVLKHSVLIAQDALLHKCIETFCPYCAGCSSICGSGTWASVSYVQTSHRLHGYSSQEWCWGKEAFQVCVTFSVRRWCSYICHQFPWRGTIRIGHLHTRARWQSEW